MQKGTVDISRLYWLHDCSKSLTYWKLKVYLVCGSASQILVKVGLLVGVYQCKEGNVWSLFYGWLLRTLVENLFGESVHQTVYESVVRSV